MYASARAEYSGMRIAVLFLLVSCAAGCVAGSETKNGDARDVVHDGGCGDANDIRLTSCVSDSECLDFFAPTSPTGRLHALCFEHTCRAAESCTDTHAGVPNYCVCGSDSRTWPACPGVCITLPGATVAQCMPACM